MILEKKVGSSLATLTKLEALVKSPLPLIVGQEPWEHNSQQREARSNFP